jgi:hypothetical protein
MGTYRRYFFDDDIIRGRFDLEADGDDRAAGTAKILFEAYSDRCQSWGIREEKSVARERTSKTSWGKARGFRFGQQRQENIASSRRSFCKAKGRLHPASVSSWN